MTLPLTIATAPVFVTGADGVRRLAAAAGDVIPDVVPATGIVSRRDPAGAGVEPFSGYDALSEDEILALLPDMEAGALEALQAYERAHQARGSIHQYGLTATVVRAARANAATPAPMTIPATSVTGGYGSLTPTALQAEIDRRTAAGETLAVRGTGAGGKVLKKDLVTALQAADRALASQA